MGKTFDQSLIDTAVISMSMIDPEDMQDTSSEEFISLRRIQQGCHSELCNRADFPFKKKNKTLKTQTNKSEYPTPDGTILEIWVKGNTKKMAYEPNIRLLKEAKGNPTSFGVKDAKTLVLYPTPDKSYEVDITYNGTKNIKDKEGLSSYTITVGSTLDMAENVQHLYFDALEYRVLFEYMRKVSNPRLSETENLFKEKWQAFLNASRVVDSETYFAI
jgi:hypothetical protein